MDFKELFSSSLTVKVKFRGYTTHHIMRTPTNDEDLEYRRKSSKVSLSKNRTLESSDAALNAPLWLYEKICERVLVENGTGEAQEVPAGERQFIPARVKLEAINAFLAEIEPGGDQAEGN